MTRRAIALHHLVSLIAVFALLGSCAESATVNSPTEVSRDVGAEPSADDFTVALTTNPRDTISGPAVMGGTHWTVVKATVTNAAGEVQVVTLDNLTFIMSGDTAFVSTDRNSASEFEVHTPTGTGSVTITARWTSGATASKQIVLIGPSAPPPTSPMPPPEVEQPLPTSPTPPSTGEQPTPPANQNPVASLTVTRVGDICTFDGSGSTDDVGIVTYTWRSSNVTLPVKYAPVIMRDCSSAYEPWTEWLIVEDAGGLVDSTSRVVEPAPVSPPPAAVFTVTLTASPRETISGPAVFGGTHWTVVKATVTNSAGEVQEVTLDNLTFTTSGDTAFATTSRDNASDFEVHTPTGTGSVTITARWTTGATASKQIFLIGPSAPPPTSPTGTMVTVNTAVNYQTMTGWQAVAEIGHEVPGYTQWRDAVLDLAAADNINRLRVEVPSGMENSRDVFTEWKAGLISESEWRCSRYTTVNDNADATVLDMSKFSFGQLDTTMTSVVLPLKERLQAHGEVLGVTISYIAFWSSCGGGQYVHADPEEYAEFAVAIMDHLRDRFGVVPDTWEIINEPDNTNGIWSVNRLSGAIVAIDRRLKQAGYQVLLVAPSHAGALNALNSYQALLATPAAALINQIGWHRYDEPAAATVLMLGNLAAARGISTAMTEHIGSGYDDLITDLTLGRASTWDQYTLAYPSSDNGAHYYIPQGSSAITGSSTKYLRHYFRHVRHGAVRVNATSTLWSVVPVAFRNTNGLVTVVMKYTTAGTITVGGLPSGRYSVGFESETTSDGTLPDIIVGSNGIATLSLQSRGVVVLYGR